LQARVHLPPCYESSGKTRYPVLYLLHGQGFTSDQWERLGFIESADKRVLAGSQPFIIVLPAEENTAANPFESGFGSALSSALVPQVDATYATCPQRTCRAIGGLSRGASWAVTIGLKNWGQFGIIGAHSFPPFFGLDRELPGLLSSIAPGQTPHMYLDIGFDDPYRAPAAAFEAILTRYGIPHEYYLNAGGHDEAYWGKHVPAYVEWYGSQFGSNRLP
jgi:enterochelin esterase-like enzyme